MHTLAKHDLQSLFLELFAHGLHHGNELRDFVAHCLVSLQQVRL